jgi:hypothetical protein
LGIEGCSLVGELVMSLGGPLLGVNLQSMDLRLLLLLIGLLLLKEEPYTWL